jgi:hypothetical protein
MLWRDRLNWLYELRGKGQVTEPLWDFCGRGATLSKTGGEDPRLEICQLINPDANEQRLGSNALSHGPACCSRRTPVITGTVEAPTTLAAADAIPESTSMALLGTGLFSLALLHRRRLKHEA